MKKKRENAKDEIVKRTKKENIFSKRKENEEELLRSDASTNAFMLVKPNKRKKKIDLMKQTPPFSVLFRSNTRKVITFPRDRIQRDITSSSLGGYHVSNPLSLYK